jgi:hypothetical protein
VILGTINLAAPDNGYAMQKSNFIIVHEEYNSERLDNDIALIKLPHPVKFSRKYLCV